MRELKLVHLFPELLNLYGEKGNVMVLKKRCRLRDINLIVTEFKISDEIDITDADIIIIGGGSKNDVLKAYEKLVNLKEKFKSYCENNGVMIGISSGYEMLGRTFSIDKEKYDGLELCGFYSEESDKRLIDNVELETDFGKIIGFTNHSARFYLDDGIASLGKVIKGFGNNETDLSEGVLYKNIFGTSLHGPLLPKNPNLADEIIKRALIGKYGEAGDFCELTTELSNSARNNIEF